MYAILTLSVYFL
jgi:hypothetical protein